MASTTFTPGTPPPPPPGGSPPPPPVDRQDTINSKCQVVEKVGRLHRTRKIAEKILFGVGIACSSIAAASICFSGLVPISTFITLTITLIAGAVGLISIVLVKGVLFKGIKKKREEAEQELHKQILQLLIVLKGQEPVAGSLPDRVLKKYGSQLKELKINCHEELYKKDREWKKEEIQGLFNTISKYTKNIKTLDLQQATKIAEIDFTHLKELKQLESLRISQSNMKNDQLKALAPLKKMKHLSLRECLCLTPEGLGYLEKWPLKSLNLHGSPLKGATAQQAEMFQLCANVTTMGFKQLRIDRARKSIRAKAEAQIKPDTSAQKRKQIEDQMQVDLNNVEEKCQELTAKRKHYLIESEEKTKAPDQRQWSPVVTGADLEFLKKFTKLETLVLSHIDDSALEKVADLKQLRRLEVTHSMAFTGSGLAKLKPLQRLSELTFGTCVGLVPSEVKHLHRNTLHYLKKISFEWNVEKYSDNNDTAAWNLAFQGIRRNFSTKRNKLKKGENPAKFNRLKGVWEAYLPNRNDLGIYN